MPYMFRSYRLIIAVPTKTIEEKYLLQFSEVDLGFACGGWGIGG